VPASVKELSGWETLIRWRNRVAAKVSKIGANVALRGADRRMRQKSWRFHQIFDANAK
jgi:hypothetical protein